MKKVSIVFLSILFLVMLVACGPADEEQNEATPEQSAPEGNGDSSTFPRPTITPESGSEVEADESYPAPGPELIGPPDAYPVAPELESVPNPYPALAGMTWIIIPAGVQCEEDKVYKNLDEAVAGLKGAGIVVNDMGSISLNVAAVCGAPSSQHYLAQVADDDVSKAEDLGWSAYEE
jgi:hypothetical protein